MNDASLIEPAEAMPVTGNEPEGLSIVSIAKAYDKKKVLSDVSLHVGRGEVLGLLGPNGAGKTTCFYSIMGLVKPDSGRIMLDGNDITGLPMYRRAIFRLGLPAAGNIHLSRADVLSRIFRPCSRWQNPTKPAPAPSGSKRLLDEFSISTSA